MRAFNAGGINVKHISEFTPEEPAIFYGILRGSGTAMRIMQYLGEDFWYVDNGYFDALYMDKNKQKVIRCCFKTGKSIFLYRQCTKNIVPIEYNSYRMIIKNMNHQLGQVKQNNPTQKAAKEPHINLIQESL